MMTFTNELVIRNFIDFETYTARSAKGSKSSKVMVKSAKADSSKGAKAASSKAEKTADAKAGKIFK